MTLEQGGPAPDFELRDQHGQTVRLPAFRGDRPVLLVFYPFVFSRVCTGELLELREHHERLVAEGVALLAVSCDPVFSLRAFTDQENIRFPLLSDFWPHGSVSRAFGAFDEKRGCSTRSTYVVDAAGVVRWSVQSPFGEARSIDDYVKVITDLRT